MPLLKAKKLRESNIVTAAVSLGNRMTNSIRPFSAHETCGAMLPAPRAQKLSLQINVELLGSQEVCGRYTDGSPRSHTLATPLRVTENIGNLGKLRQPPLLKARHTHGNTLPGWADFYPLLAIVRGR